MFEYNININDKIDEYKKTREYKNNIVEFLHKTATELSIKLTPYEILYKNKLYCVKHKFSFLYNYEVYCNNIDLNKIQDEIKNKFYFNYNYNRKIKNLRKYDHYISFFIDNPYSAMMFLKNNNIKNNIVIRENAIDYDNNSIEFKIYRILTNLPQIEKSNYTPWCLGCIIDNHEHDFFHNISSRKHYQLLLYHFVSLINVCEFRIIFSCV